MAVKQAAEQVIRADNTCASFRHCRLQSAFKQWCTGKVLSAMIVLGEGTKASGKPSLGLVLPLNSGVRFRLSLC